MPDLVFSWRMLGVFPGEFGPSQSADVGGVEVAVDVTGLSTNARAFGLDAPFHVAPGEPFDPSSGFKLFGDGAEGGPQETLTATIGFAATDPAFGDAVENVSFRVADIDAGAAGDIPGGPAGSHVDLVTIRAYDADGNAVPVTITPGTGILQSGDLLTGTAEDQDPTSADASALVEIAGPVARIEIDYANGADSEQRIIVSDLHFSTTDPGPALDGIVEGTAGDDLIDLAYDGDPEGDVIDGGDNIFPGLGPDDDIVKAGAGNDTVFAETGDDTVQGGAGDDLIDGGAGTDVLSGGDDRDTFTGAGGGDSVDGGEGGDDFDTLDLTGRGPVAVDPTSEDGEDGLAVIAETGEVVTFENIEAVLSDDPSGRDGIVSGTEAGEVIDVNYDGDPDGDRIDAGDAILPGAAPDDDVVVAGGGDDSVVAGLGDDFVLAGAGDDFADGGDGNDTLYGGLGADTLDGQDGDDDVSGQDGDDALATGAGADSASGGAGADTLDLGAGDDTGAGGAGDDYIDAAQGDDLMRGGDGDDTLDAGQGRDTAFGGAGDDVLTGNPGDDRLSGGAGADTISGNDGTDVLEGGAGDDLIGTGFGADSVAGGDDRDTIIVVEDPTGLSSFVDGNEGGEDFDTLRVIGTAEVEFDPENAENGVVHYLDDEGVRTGATTTFVNIETVEIVDPSALDGVVEGTDGADLIDLAYTGDPEGDRVDSFDSLEVFDDQPIDSLERAGFEEILGGTPRGDNRDAIDAGAGDDTALGLDGDDVIYGGDGNDSIDGGIGFDDLSGDAGDDTIVGGLGQDKLFGDGGNDALSGGDQADTLVGGAGDDSLDAGGGEDRVIGGPGADTIDGGVGADSIEGGADDDSILGGLGDDTIDAGEGANFVDAGLGDNIVVSGAGSDTLIGGVGDDSFDAGAGDDVLVGGGGQDTLEGGEGDDAITGGTPGVTGIDAVGQTPDSLVGGLGADTLDGSSGGDTISGGDGADQITGGTGGDTIDAGAGADVVYGDSEFDVLAGGFVPQDPGFLDGIAAEGGDDSIVGGDGDDTIFGEFGSDTIDGGAGDDLVEFGAGNGAGTLIGGAGDDTLIGGPGADLILGLAGNDSLDGGQGADVMDGGADDDVMLGGQGADLMEGGTGGDTITGGVGADRLSGGDDEDLFLGATGGDNIAGGAGGVDFDTLDLTGSGPLRIVDTTTDSDGNGLDGTVEFLDGSGGVTGSATFTNIEEIIPCFTPGTVIATPRGERLVEDLKPGDRVITRDNGIQEIVWVGAKTLTGHQLARMPHLRPILIEAGALGNGLPERDLLVSPNHRLLVANDKTTLYFDEREVLAAAKHLTGLEGVDEVGTLGVTYLHFMFERHEVVLSNGAWTESFQPGDYTLKGIGNAQRNEILELFPELEEDGAQGDFRAARRTLKKHEARLLHD